MHIAPISREAFAPFGTILSTDGHVAKEANQGSASRFDFAVDLVNLRPEAKLNVAIFRCAPRAMPFSVVLLERHAASTQLFVPMDVDRYVVIVAPSRADGGPDTGNMQAFLVPGDTGVAYAPGTWHHPMIALDRPSLFSASMWEDGSEVDCETHPLSPTEWATIDAGRNR